MKRPGIPPCPDLKAYRRKGALLILATAAAVVLALVTFFVVTERGQPRRPSLIPPIEDVEQADAAQELEDAYAAAQGFIIRELGLFWGQEVEWLERQHEGHYGQYRFYGHFNIRYRDESLSRVYYEVQVRLDRKEGWQLEDTLFRTSETLDAPQGQEPLSPIHLPGNPARPAFQRSTA